MQISLLSTMEIKMNMISAYKVYIINSLDKHEWKQL